MKIKRDETKRAIDQSREHYVAEGADFAEELAWHIEKGFVVNVPYLFAMGYFYKDEESGPVICHVSYFCGDIKFLLMYGLDNYIDKVEFMRNFGGDIKRYDYEVLKRRLKYG